MSRKVSYFKTHQPLFVPGIGNLKDTFDAHNMTGVEMNYTDLGLEVSYKGVQFIVPLPNVQSAVFADTPKRLK